jgi:hypothetical protein
MKSLCRSTLPLALLLCTGLLTAADPASKKEGDPRLGVPTTLNDYFPLKVPASKEAWQTRRQALREQVLVGLGLWPLPEKTPLKPVIHGKIDRGEYTVEKVFFASLPGHYVTGNLYRPRANGERKLPAVLCPHGHWANGRFYEANDNAVNSQIKQGAEKTAEGARYPLQARCAQLARMGCVVFHYDMVGYADSKQIGHRSGFTDAEAELRLQSFMGLQAWNSIRALDFLLSLPEVDPKRVGVTGASGGGTQTFILAGIDDRPAVAFPAVMVSTGMQGGCICENCSYLRQEGGNIDLAALFAPKPLGMTGANDWTVEIEKKGLPELKAVYRLYGAEDRVLARCFPQFGHNYNQVSREVMYNWFNKHLHLGQKDPVVEQPFKPIPPKELSVFDAEHPLPKDAVGADRLRQYMTKQSDRQINALIPKDAGSLREFRRVIGTALRVMTAGPLPAAKEVEVRTGERKSRDGVTVQHLLLGRRGTREAVPAVEVRGAAFDGTVVVCVHPEGKAGLYQDGKLVPEARKLIDGKAAVLAIDPFWTGELKGTVVQVSLDSAKLKTMKVSARSVQTVLKEKSHGAFVAGNTTYLFFAPGQGAGAVEAVARTTIRGKPQTEGSVAVRDVARVSAVDRAPINSSYAGYTFGYNRTLLANRVHDILTAVACARILPGVKKVDLVGLGEAGPWVLLARGQCGDAVARTAADVNGFRFEKVRTTSDPMMMPGALKYGGLPALAALAAPGELFTYNHRGTGMGRWLKPAYAAAAAPGHWEQSSESIPAAKLVDWLLR